MIKNILLVLVTLLITSSFNGCAIKNIRGSNNFSEAVSTVSEEFNHYISDDEKQNTIVFTSMVDVNNLRQSSNFGRLYSDSLLTNLKRSGWSIIDYRGMKIITTTKKGEFYLSREELSKLPQKHNYVVGTYSLYGNKLLINVRILKAGTNEVIVASNSTIDDPAIIRMVLRDNCKDLRCFKPKVKPFMIKLKKDDCKNPSRCECQNPDGCLSERKE